MRVFVATIAMAVSLGTMVGCGSDHGADQQADNVRVRADEQTSTTNRSASKKWKDAGAQIVLNRKGDDTASSFGPYLSRPIDITANGEYTVVIGPLSAADKASDAIFGITVPDDVQFTARPSHQMTTFEEADGQTYGKFSLDVTDFRASYIGLTVWTQ